MSRSLRSFLLGVLSVFSFERVRLFESDDVELDLNDISTFADDSENIRQDFENVGRDIQKILMKIE